MANVSQLPDHTCKTCGGLMIRVMRSSGHPDSVLWCEVCGSIRFENITNPYIHGIPARFYESPYDAATGRYAQHVPDWSKR